MSLPEQRWSIWRERLRGFALDHVDLGLGVLVTLLGLILFRFSGIGAIDSRAGFAFLQSIEQSSLDLRFEVRGAVARTPGAGGTRGAGTGTGTGTGASPIASQRPTK